MGTASTMACLVEALETVHLAAFVIVTTGAPFSGTLCDTAARWEAGVTAAGVLLLVGLPITVTAAMQERRRA